MTIAALHPLHDARATGSRPAVVSGCALPGARVGGACVAFGAVGLSNIDRSSMQDVRGFRPRASTIGAGVGQGGRTLHE